MVVRTRSRTRGVRVAGTGHGKAPVNSVAGLYGKRKRKGTAAKKAQTLRRRNTAPPHEHYPCSTCGGDLPRKLRDRGKHPDPAVCERVRTNGKKPISARTPKRRKVKS